MDLQGGTLSATSISVKTAALSNLDGGTANFTNFLLNDTSAVTASGNEFIGIPGDGLTASNGVSTFIQTGTSSNTITGVLVLDHHGSIATYNLQSGTLSAAGELEGFAGDGGVAKFVQTGGTNTVGPADGLSVTLADPLDPGTFALADGTLYVGYAATSDYDLQGGTLNADQINVLLNSTFEFAGGVANFNIFLLGDTATVTDSGNEVIGTATNPGSSFTQFASSQSDISTNTIVGALVLGLDAQSGSYSWPAARSRSREVIGFDGGGSVASSDRRHQYSLPPGQPHCCHRSRHQPKLLIPAGALYVGFVKDVASVSRIFYPTVGDCPGGAARSTWPPPSYRVQNGAGGKPIAVDAGAMTAGKRPRRRGWRHRKSAISAGGFVNVGSAVEIGACKPAPRAPSRSMAAPLTSATTRCHTDLGVGDAGTGNLAITAGGKVTSQAARSAPAPATTACDAVDGVGSSVSCPATCISAS